MKIATSAFLLIVGIIKAVGGTPLEELCNVLAALRIEKRLGPGQTVASLICDTGLKYLSTDLYSAYKNETSRLALVQFRRQEIN